MNYKESKVVLGEIKKAKKILTKMNCGNLFKKR